MIGQKKRYRTLCVVNIIKKMTPRQIREKREFFYSRKVAARGLDLILMSLVDERRLRMAYIIIFYTRKINKSNG